MGDRSRGYVGAVSRLGLKNIILNEFLSPFLNLLYKYLLFTFYFPCSAFQEKKINNSLKFSNKYKYFNFIFSSSAVCFRGVKKSPIPQLTSKIDFKRSRRTRHCVGECTQHCPLMKHEHCPLSTGPVSS